MDRRLAASRSTVSVVKPVGLLVRRLQTAVVIGHQNTVAFTAVAQVNVVARGAFCIASTTTCVTSSPCSTPAEPCQQSVLLVILTFAAFADLAVRLLL